MLTIREIAKIAKCSQSTVSKALNDRPDVSEKTKLKIRKIASEHNFAPHTISKLLENQVTENIGVVFCRESKPLSGNPFYSRVLEGIEGELVINNYNLVLHLLPDPYNGDLPKMIKERKIDGIILIGIMNLKFIDQLKKINLPVILVDPAREHDHFSKIIIDNERGAFMATQNLIENGHKKIGFISGNLERSSFRQRFEGFKRAMEYNKIPIQDEYIHDGGVEMGYEQVTSLLNLKDRPTAIFCTNDTNALYGYKAIIDNGLKIPDDISIAGFDDVSMAKYSSPPLSTVRVYKEEIGSVAVRELLWQIREKTTTPTTTLVPTRFIQRDSVKNIVDI